MKKTALILAAIAFILGGIGPAFAWDHRHRDWREERHYRPYPYYRLFPQIIVPIPIPPIYAPYPTYPVCTQVWTQPQWVWDVLYNQWVMMPGYWQTICQ